MDKRRKWITASACSIPRQRPIFPVRTRDNRGSLALPGPIGHRIVSRPDAGHRIPALFSRGEDGFGDYDTPCLYRKRPLPFSAKAFSYLFSRYDPLIPGAAGIQPRLHRRRVCRAGIRTFSIDRILSRTAEPAVWLAVYHDLPISSNNHTSHFSVYRPYQKMERRLLLFRLLPPAQKARKPGDSPAASGRTYQDFSLQSRSRLK